MTLEVERMNNSVILILVLGLALMVGVVVLLGTSLGKSAPAPERLLPSSVEGFSLTMKLDRVEPSPSSPGEEYSAHAFFAPAAGGEFAGEVDSLGIAIFRFKGEEAAQAAKEALLKGLKTERIEIAGKKAALSRTVELFYQEGQVGIIWHEGRLLYEVLVTSPMGSKANIEVLKEAARRAAGALIK